MFEYFHDFLEVAILYLVCKQNGILEHSVHIPFKTDLKSLILVFTISYRFTPYVRENVHNQRRRTLKM